MKKATALVLSTAGGVAAVQAADAWAPPPTKADKVWILPSKVPEPADNLSTKDKVVLGKTLFFDPRLSANGNMSCASCHNPSMGWSDGLPVARGHDGKQLGRATPSIANMAYNTVFMWDGRKKTLEEQALGPMESKDEMHSDFNAVFGFLSGNAEYVKMFAAAFPNEPISEQTLAKAIASYERSVVVRDTPFDRWLAGDRKALSMAQWRGFQLFKDKAMCVKCHSAPNFTDNGFHNLGLAGLAREEPDLGRYQIKKVKSNQGAFKTSPLRDVESTAPYFHDGSARTLEDVVAHYVEGGKVKTNLSPNFNSLDLTTAEQQDLVQFLKALTPNKKPEPVPVLPK